MASITDHQSSIQLACTLVQEFDLKRFSALIFCLIIISITSNSQAELPPYNAEAVCGDGMCQSYLGESSSVCPVDCYLPPESITGDQVSDGEDEVSCADDCLNDQFAEEKNEENPLIEFVTGTSFTYNGVSITSSKEIDLLIEDASIDLAYLIVKGDAAKVTLTVTGLNPSNLYYVYADSFKNKLDNNSDVAGTVSFTLNLAEEQIVMIQSQPGTVYISEDTTLTGDVYDSIQINADNVTLDCDGHTISTSSTAIYANAKSNITIKNCNIWTGYRGMLLFRSYAVNIINNTVRGGRRGIALGSTVNATLIGNDINVGSYGDYNLYVYSGGTTIVPGSAFDHDIDLSNTINGNQPILYVNGESNKTYDGDIDGDYGVVYVVDSDNVTVKNAKLAQNNWMGVWLINTNNSTIDNLIIPNYYINGIRADYDYGSSGVGLTFSNNVISTNSPNYSHDPVLSYKSASPVFTGNEITNTGYRSGSVYLRYAPNAVVTNNTTSGDVYLYIDGDNSIVTGNVVNNGSIIVSGHNSAVTDNVTHGRGIHIDNGTNSVVSRNEINNSSYRGISLFASDDSLVENNTIINADYAGIYVEDPVKVKNNTISRSGYGVMITRLAGGTVVEGNEILDSSEHGIYIEADRNNIHGNTVSNSSKNGVWVRKWSDNNNIVNNTISHSGYNGIFFYQGGGGAIDGNAISNSRYNGIWLDYFSENNTVTNNAISNSGYSGMYLTRSSDNTIENNTIADSGSNGIYLNYSYGYASNRNLVRGNTISDSVYNNVFIGLSDSNVIEQNVMGYAYLIGIMTVYADNNTLRNNDYSSSNMLGWSRQYCSPGAIVLGWKSNSNYVNEHLFPGETSVCEQVVDYGKGNYIDGYDELCPNEEWTLKAYESCWDRAEREEEKLDHKSETHGAMWE